MKFLILASIIVLSMIGIVGVQESFATEPCTPISGKQIWTGNSEIFTASVTSKEINGNEGIIGFKVTTIFKGTPEQNWEITVSSEGHPGNFFYVRGANDYIVGSEVFFAQYVREDGSKGTHNCHAGNGFRIPDWISYDDREYGTPHPTFNEFMSYLSLQMKVPSPKEQQELGIEFGYLNCKYNLKPILRNSDSFACVTDETKKKLDERKLTLDFNYSTILNQSTVLTSSGGKETIIPYWSDGEDVPITEYRKTAGYSKYILIKTNSDNGGRFLLSIPYEQIEKYFQFPPQRYMSEYTSDSKIIAVDNENVILEMKFPKGESTLSLQIQ